MKSEEQPSLAISFRESEPKCLFNSGSSPNQKVIIKLPEQEN